MYKRLGLGAVAAGMLALAAPAEAVTVNYEGLGFNNVDQVCGPWFCVPNYRFSRIGDEATDLGGGGIELNEPIVLGNVGQAVYTVTGNAIDSTGGLAGGSISFGQASKTLDFGDHKMRIVGGTLGIEDSASSPQITLPFGLGQITPDYQLTGHLDVEFNGVGMTFYVCESLDGNLCDEDDGNDRPWGSGQPYNTLNVGNGHSDEVGNGDGSTDLAMFLYMRGECADESCPFYEEWTERESRWVYDYWYKKDGEWVHVTGQSACPGEKIKIDGDWYNIYEDDSKWSDKGCDKDKVYETVTRRNKDIYIKVALWGAEPQQTTVPEPATLSLLGLGLLGLGFAARRRAA